MCVLIISYNKFPEGDAISIREYTFGKIFSKMGYKVFFIGMGDTPCYDIGVFKGFEYTSLRIIQNQSSLQKSLENYFGFKQRLKQFITQYSAEDKIEAILVVNIPLNALFFIKRFAKKNKIYLIHDSVDWYSSEQFKLKRFDPLYILKELSYRIFIDKSFKVIAISKYLENHFKSRGIETIRIPVIMDVNKLSCEKHTREDKLTILYAGTPGKRDYLKEVINGISLLNSDEIEKIELRLIGFTLEQMKSDLDIDKNALNKIKNNINILGRVPREIVLENLKQADFTVLLRSPVQRYAKAGFPTKVVESLASATPVILNITSDLGDYITDMKQGLIVEECSSLAFCDAVRRAIKLTYQQKCDMYLESRKCAEKNFDYIKFEKQLSIFIFKNMKK